MYLERLNRFSEDNPYYKIGGEFNTYQGDVMMPNCCAYAYLRMEEAMELQTKDNYLIRESGGFGNAKTWFDTTPLPKGYELKSGCIGVFNGVAGHVLWVERKIDDTHAIITESQYDDDKTLRNYKYWNRRTVELEVGKATLGGVGALIGFIYPSIKDIRTERKNKPQIEITEEFVNVRTSADGSVKNIGCYCPMGIYDVLNTKEVDGFVWYKIDSKSWVKYYPVEDDSLKTENEQLKADMKKIEEIVRKWV